MEDGSNVKPVVLELRNGWGATNVISTVYGVVEQ